MTVLQRFCCVASGVAVAVGIVAACSAAPGSGSTISSIDSAGGSGGAGALGAGTAGISGAGGIPPAGYIKAPPGNGQPGDGPMITTPISTVDASAATKCSAVESKGKQVTVDLFIMFDQSLSMSCAVDSPSNGTAGASGAGGAPAGGATGGGGAAGNGDDRWTVVKGALEQFVTAPAAAGLNVGIQYFGLAGAPSLFGATSSCNAADYQGADVEIAPLPGNAQPIVDSLDRHSPSTNTPTPPALTGAINHAIAWKNKNPDHAVVVVLVTDGQPNGCGTVADVVNVARQGFMSSIPTYVIGVTSPGTTCPIDQNPPNQQDLDSVANAGGTQASLIVDLSKDTAKQFLDTMDKIRARSNPPCQFSLPPAPAGESLDPTKVNVEYTPPGAPMPETLTGVSAASACDPTTGGWFYDNPVTPKAITLCPATCTRAMADISGQVNIAVGCETKTTR
ncbi:MAG TPA: vWA domain-containing protein [Polyangiaceae bacterium]|jgi:hypothetical protein|nr:vWA domain-containing protein [Polyangiaceae bacterium]